MATKKELIEMLKPFGEDEVIVCMDERGGWDNIESVEKKDGSLAIVFGGGSPFSDGG